MKRVGLLVLFFGVTLSFAQSAKESSDFSYALKLYDQEFYDLAASQFIQFYKNYPSGANTPEARFYAGMSFFQLKNYDRAREEFQTLALQFPKSKRAAESWFRAGTCSQLNGYYKEAIKSFQSIRLLYPQNSFAAKGLYQAGLLQLQIKANAEAYRNFSIILDRYRNSSVYYAALAGAGRSLLAQNEPDKAKNLVRQILDSQADNKIKSSARLLFAQILEEEGYGKKARENYRAIIKNYSTEAAFPLAILGLSRSYLQDKKYDLARKYLSVGLSKNKNPTMRLLLGDVDFLQEKFALAQKEYMQASASLSDSLLLTVRLKQALCYRHLGAKKRSLDILHRALKTFPLKQAPLFKAVDSIYLNWLEETANYSSVLIILNKRLMKEGAVNYNRTLRMVKALAKLKRWRDIIHLLQPFYLSQKPFVQKDDFLFYLALANEKIGRYDQSAYLYKKLVTDFAASEYYEKARSRLHFLNDFKIVRKDKAVDQLSGLIGNLIGGEAKSSLLYELGRIYFEDLKEYAKAEQQFLQALKDSSRAHIGDIYLFLGKTYLKLDSANQADHEKYLKQATDFFKKAANASAKCSAPDEASWLLVNTVFQADTISLSTQKKYIETLISRYPNSPLKETWYANLAFTLAFDSRYENVSLKYFKQLTANYKNSENYPAYLSGYAGLLEQTDSSRALDLYRELALNYAYAHEAASALYKVAHAYEAHKQFAEAGTLYNKLLHEYFYSALAKEVREKQGIILSRSGQNDLAISVLKKQLLSPFLKDFVLSSAFLSDKTLARLYFLAMAYEKKGISSEAVKTFRLYLRLAGSDTYRDQARFKLAEIYYHKNRMETALENFLAVGRKDPLLYLTARRYAAEIYFKQKNYVAAIPVYSELAENAATAKEKEAFQARRIVSLIRLGQIKNAAAEITAFKKKYPKAINNVALFTVELGNHYRLQKNFKKAIKLFKRVLKKYGKSGYADDADYFLAVTFITLNKVKEAFAILSKFYSNHNGSNRLSAALNTLGNLYFRSEKYDNAIAMFKNALQVNKDQSLKANILSNLIKAYTQTGFWDAAQATARKYVQEFPYAPDRLDKEIIIARAYINLNQFQNAVEYLKKIKLQADAEREPEIQFYIGEALQKAGQYENAIAEFVKIPLLSKKTKLQWEASALYYSGQCYEKLGRIQDAIRMYQEIIRRPGIDLVLKKDAQKRIRQIQ